MAKGSFKNTKYDAKTQIFVLFEYNSNLDTTDNFDR